VLSGWRNVVKVVLWRNYIWSELWLAVPISPISSTYSKMGIMATRREMPSSAEKWENGITDSEQGR